MYANVNFLPRDKDGRATEAPFIPEDFIGKSDREKRTKEAAEERRAVMVANIALQNMKAGEPSDDVPDWARGEYHGS